MKVLLVSADAIYNENKFQIFSDIIPSLLDLETSNPSSYKVVIISTNPYKLQIIEKYLADNLIVLTTKVVSREERHKKKLISDFSNQFQVPYANIILLGANNNDLYLASNAQILLLSARYTGYTDRVMKYGIGISSPSSLKALFENFLSISNPWYFRLKLDAKTEIYSLTNAMTYVEPNPDYVKIAANFQDILKRKLKRNNNLFAIYTLISAHSIETADILREVDYWGIYPSSGIEYNAELDYFKEGLRLSFNSKEKEPIFIRHTLAPKRQWINWQKRVNDGCDDQLSTMIINPYYRGKLKNKTVCIIDDFTTFGTSAETARCLLYSEEIKKLIFITMGKFTREKIAHCIYNYQITGDVFDNFSFNRIDNTRIVHVQPSFINSNSNQQIVQSLGNLLL